MNDDLKTTSSYKKNRLIAAWNLIPGRFLVLILWGIVFACDQRKEILDAPHYEGPLSSLDSAITWLSDSGRVVMKMESDVQSNFENGDREWPDGFFIRWYDRLGNLKSSFSANYVYFTKAENLYRAEGDVIVKSFENNDELNTEELFWDMEKETFYTDKFVTIKSDDEVHTGEGMESNEDFTEYRILKPNGTFTLEDDPNQPSEPNILIKPAAQEK